MDAAAWYEWIFTKQNGNHGFNDSSKVDSLLLTCYPWKSERAPESRTVLCPKFDARTDQFLQSNQKKPGWLGYVTDYTTQLYWDYASGIHQLLLIVRVSYPFSRLKSVFSSHRDFLPHLIKLFFFLRRKIFAYEQQVKHVFFPFFPLQGPLHQCHTYWESGVVCSVPQAKTTPHSCTPAIGIESPFAM